MLKVLKTCDWLLNRLVLLVALSALCASGYVIWDNHQIYAEARNVRADLYELKPDTEGNEPPDFDVLKAINPDVCGWLTVDNTGIDYPIVRGTDNIHYMDTDFYGNFSLAGSIFLDSRNDKEFKDAYSILYGHHMDNHLMFGDLDLFKDKEFFDENRTASILTESGETEYQVLAFGEISDSVREIFDPELWGTDLSGLADAINRRSLHVWDPAMHAFVAHPSEVSVVALITCSSGSTGTRTVLFLITSRTSQNDPLPPPDAKPDSPNAPTKPPQTGDILWNSSVLWIVTIGIAVAVLFILRIVERKRKTDKEQKV